MINQTIIINFIINSIQIITILKIILQSLNPRIDRMIFIRFVLENFLCTSLKLTESLSSYVSANFKVNVCVT